MLTKKRFITRGCGALLIALALAACGGKKDPAAIAAELEKIQEQALEAAESGDTAKITKLAAEAAKLAAELEKAQTAAADKPAKAGKVVTGGKEAKETDFIYELNKAGDGVIITGYQKDAAGGAVVIPAKIEGYPVVAVTLPEFGPELFGEYSGYWDNERRGYKTDAEVKAAGRHPYITSVVFPDSITEISRKDDSERFFFSGNPKLTSIVLPKNLKEIPRKFAGIKSLSAVKWPETLEIIGREAFRRAGFTELVIPEGVKEIRDEAFEECEKLTSVTIPSSIEWIGEFAFNNCPLLTTVKIPAKTIQYGSSYWEKSNNAFKNCPKLSLAVRKAITDTGYKGEF
jgi:hypothetical protein